MMWNLSYSFSADNLDEVESSLSNFFVLLFILFLLFYQDYLINRVMAFSTSTPLAWVIHK